jgi:dTDP-4-dehydrorhamnose reductase
MKILILGAGGMAGSMITKYLKNYYEPDDVTGLLRDNFDVLNNDIPDLSNYDYVINCIGLIKQKSSDDKLFFTINSDFPKKLAKKHKKIIHISSDCVFSGKLSMDKKYNTNDIRDAQDSYGKSKADGELINAMILRTSIIGPSKDNSGLFEWFKNTTENPVNGFCNHWWSGITTLELAKIINDIIRNDKYKHGIYQISSEPISKYALLCIINNIFNLNKNIFISNSTEDINRILLADIKASALIDQLNELKKYTDEIS